MRVSVWPTAATRLALPACTICERSSSVQRWTSASAPTSASMSRGTTRSTIRVGRRLRALTARKAAPRPITGRGLTVHETTMSNSPSRAIASGKPIDCAPKWAASASPRAMLRFATVSSFGDLAARCASTGAALWPAPRNNTSSSPKSSSSLPASRTITCREADRVHADLGAGAHLFRNRERALEQLVQRGAQGAGRVGLAHRELQLAEDLRFADHHRREAAREAECVARGEVARVAARLPT